MKRPTISNELVATVAASFCTRRGWDADQAADIARVYRANMDGYELAKELDNRCGWMPTAQDVDALDSFSDRVRKAHREVCIAWARDNNVQPPLPVGAMTTRGEITGIYKHDAACYEIRESGDQDSARRLIVRFEDARALTVETVGAA